MRRPTTIRLTRAALVLGLTVLAMPASAQFGWFGQSEASPRDVVATIGEHGFQLVGPLYRNGRAYVADVLDRRGRRERLVVSAESGQIVQRFFVEVGPTDRRQAMAERPRPRDDDSFFDRLSRGWGDDPAPRPPLSVPDGARPDTETGTVFVPRARRVEPRAEPRVVTRTDLPPPRAATPSPVPGPATPPAAAPAKPDAAPAASATPTPPASPPRGTAVTTDPLRIPGTRKAPEPKPAAAAVATAKPPEPQPAAPASPLPSSAMKPAQPVDVPVAPLD